MNKNQEALPTMPLDISALATLVGDLPEEHRRELEPAMGRVVEYVHRRYRILNLIQEALQQLRMDMKYLMFDLEATRRERDEYKNRLGE
jgi:hypothetical protein